jgi:hypothetical protein
MNRLADQNPRYRLQTVPVTFAQAAAFIELHHRTHKSPVGMKFAIGAATPEGELVGVLIASRPIARHFDDGLTIEVTRSCTDGTANANSLLYGAASRAAFALGYLRVITYTQKGESGASLRAAGWHVVAERPARGSWAESSVKLRSLKDRVGSGGIQRTLWEVEPNVLPRAWSNADNPGASYGGQL